MGLRYRFLLVILAVSLAASAAALLSFSRVVSRVAGNLGAGYARQYALADRALLQEPLAREIALARQLAQSPVIRAWAREESDPDARRRALAELESYRTRFAAASWFYVVDASLNYYYDDSEHPYGQMKLAYTLDRDSEKDAWYFATLAQVPEYALNVNYDLVLDALKVWINIVIREPDGSPLGVSGTGIELTEFLRLFIDLAEPGVESIVLDRRLAIQAHRDRDLIDYQSLAKEEADRSTVARLLDGPADLGRLQVAIDRLHQGSGAETVEVGMAGTRKLVGVTYLSALDWYVLSVLDLDVLIGRRVFAPIAFLGIVALLFTTGSVAIAVSRMVVRPLGAITETARRMAEGEYGLSPPASRVPEFVVLSKAFTDMARSIRRNTAELESRVQERTTALDASNRKLEELVRALEEAATTDPLTGLLNRRGMLSRIEPETARVARGNASLAFVLIDLDHFKLINDTHGHEAGDRVLVEVAAAIRRSVRSYDHCARWGGEEILVAAPGIGQDDAAPLAEKLREVIAGLRVETPAGTLRVTASVGACLVAQGESLRSSLARADGALYRAKEEGRNRVVLALPPEQGRALG